MKANNFFVVYVIYLWIYMHTESNTHALRANQSTHPSSEQSMSHLRQILTLSRQSYAIDQETISSVSGWEFQPNLLQAKK